MIYIVVLVGSILMLEPLKWRLWCMERQIEKHEEIMRAKEPPR
jgi:hypothetical protein